MDQDRDKGGFNLLNRSILSRIHNLFWRLYLVFRNHLDRWKLCSSISSSNNSNNTSHRKCSNNSRSRCSRSSHSSLSKSSHNSSRNSNNCNNSLNLLISLRLSDLHNTNNSNYLMGPQPMVHLSDPDGKAMKSIAEPCPLPMALLVLPTPHTELYRLQTPRTVSTLASSVPDLHRLVCAWPTAMAVDQYHRPMLFTMVDHLPPTAFHHKSDRIRSMVPARAN